MKVDNAGGDMINNELIIPRELLKFKRVQSKSIRQWINRLVQQDKVQDLYNSKQWYEVSNKVIRAYDNHCVICDNKSNSNELNVINLSDIYIYPMNALQPVVMDPITLKDKANIIPLCNKCYKKIKINNK